MISPVGYSYSSFAPCPYLLSKTTLPRTRLMVMGQAGFGSRLAAAMLCSPARQPRRRRRW
jgi:hypothetical protein